MKRTRTSGEDEVVVANKNHEATSSKNEQAATKMVKLMTSAHVGPVLDENMNATCVQIFSIALLENMQKAVSNCPWQYSENGGNERVEGSTRALAALERRINELDSEATHEGFRVLKGILTAERSGVTMEAHLGFVPHAIMGQSVGCVSMSTSKVLTNNCLFLILRKVNALLLMQEVGFMRGKDSKEAMEWLEKAKHESKMAVLLKRSAMVGKSANRKKEIAQALEELKAEKKRLDLQRKNVQQSMDEKAMAMEKLKDKIEQTWGMLTSGRQEEDVDQTMLELMQTMKQNSEQALREATDMQKKELRQVEERLAALADEIKEKTMDSRNCSSNASEGVESEASLEASVFGIYDSMKEATWLCDIRKHVTILMALPEVLQEARMRMFFNIKVSVEEALNVQRYPAPPPPPGY